MLAIDGSPVGNNVSGSSAALVLPGLTTTQPNDIIVVQYAEDGVGDTSTTVTSANLVFTKRAASPGSVVSEWLAVAAAPLTGEVITITLSGAVTYFVGCAFAISGADTGAIFDSNVSLPVAGNASADPTFSTTAQNTIVIAGIGAGVATPTPGSGWNLLYNAGAQFFISMYQIFSSPQTGATAALATGSGAENRYVVDAIIQSAAAHAGQSLTSGTFQRMGLR